MEDIESSPELLNCRLALKTAPETFPHIKNIKTQMKCPVHGPDAEHS